MYWEKLEFSWNVWTAAVHNVKSFKVGKVFSIFL